MSLDADSVAMFRDSIASYLAGRYHDAERRRVYESEAGWSQEHWRAFAELGLLGAGFEESVGGLGGGLAEQAVIMEQFGSALVLEPYLSTVVIGGGLLKHGSMAGAELFIRAIVEGTIRIAYAQGEPGTRYNHAHVETTAVADGGSYIINGNKAVVFGAAAATHIVCVARTSGDTRDPDGVSAFLIDTGAQGITRRDGKTISGALISELRFENVRVPEERLLAPAGQALPLIDRVIDEATLAVCAEAVGVMRRLHADTLAYTEQRKQFGKALASFQALQHRMADMMIQWAHAASLVDRAIAAMESSHDDAARLVSATKVYIGKSARYCGQNAIQLHGGMGMTDELAIGFFFKRAIEIERQFGTTDHHLSRYERLSYRAPPRPEAAKAPDHGSHQRRCALHG